MKVTHPKLPFDMEIDSNGRSVIRYPNFSVDGGPADAAIAVLLEELDLLKQRVAALEAQNTVAADPAPEILSTGAEVAPEMVEEPAIAPLPSKVNPNLDSVEQLEALPYVGSVTAKKVESLRQESEFVDFDDFYKRSGLKLKASEKEHLSTLLEFKF